MAWVVRACGVLRDVCWACWRQARSREPRRHASGGTPSATTSRREPYDDFRPSRWCHGGILQSVGRSEPLPATPTLPGRGARARQFPISRSDLRAPPVATPPALFGAGADGHPEAPDRRPLGACPYRRQCAECSPPKFIGGLPQTVMGGFREVLVDGVARHAVGFGDIRDADSSRCCCVDGMPPVFLFAGCVWLLE